MKTFALLLSITASAAFASAPPPSETPAPIVHLFDLVADTAQWLNGFGEFIVPQKFEWGHYAAKPAVMGAKQCHQKNSTLGSRIDKRTPVKAYFAHSF